VRRLEFRLWLRFRLWLGFGLQLIDKRHCNFARCSVASFGVNIFTLIDEV
jgi:hypothetical protein